jgi:hypothetical protein
MLKNTPNLKLLQLRYFPITTYHLEKLHANVPHLETLRICDFAPDSNNRAEPSLLNNASLKPALLKRLDLEINRFRTNFLPAFLDYILLKYPSLQEFDFAVPYGGIGDAWESFFPHLLRSTKNTLTKFKVNTYTESPNLISLLKDHAIFTLTTLELNLFDDQQQEEHKKIHDIIDFVQDGNIQSLSLTDIPDIDFGVFQKLDKLKELKLAFRSEQTHNTALHRVVQELPQSLETFSLSKAHIYLKQQEEPVISGIKRLELLECQVQSDLSDFLSNQLPLLDAFILRTSQMMFNLRLRHAHLSLVDIYITQGAWKYTVHDVFVQPQKYFICHPFKATVGKKTSVYYHPYEVKIHMNSEAYFKNLFDVHDHSMYYFYKASTVPLQYGQPHFHFQCESVHTFLYNDCLIFV